MPNVTPPPPKRKLLDQVRDACRLKHYSRRTEDTYADWIKRYILFHKKRHPQDMSVKEIEQFLTHLAVDRNVAASTQNQAYSAILFLYRYVLHIDLPDINAVRAKKPKRLPVVLTRDEARRVIDQLDGTPKLMVQLLYGSGLRLNECVRLRVKDLDFIQKQILIREAKGNADRVTMLPASLIEPLQAHLRRVKQLHTQDLKAGYGSVYLPTAFDRKYPNAATAWREAGSTSSRRTACPKTRRPALPAATMPATAASRKSSPLPLNVRASPNRSAPTPFVIPSPPTYWKVATILGQFKNCSATRM